jgi:3-oxoacyl-[acyl-carrier protein] reductase
MGILAGKTAIITGASRGIGKATAELFLKEGANLVLTAHQNVKLLNELAKNKQVLVVKADLRLKDDIKKLVKDAFDKFSTIDILVSNAGTFEIVDFEEIEESHFDEVMNLDLKGAFFLAQRVIPYFRKQGHGKIVNVSSLSGKIGSASAPHYAAAKAGIIALTKSLARKYGKDNINVNAIAPSLINTDMVKSIPKERLDKLVDAVPLKRLGSPDEVAKLILFLASPAADYITGQTISIDGGMSMI